MNDYIAAGYAIGDANWEYQRSKALRGAVDGTNASAVVTAEEDLTNKYNILQNAKDDEFNKATRLCVVNSIPITSPTQLPDSDACAKRVSELKKAESEVFTEEYNVAQVTNMYKDNKATELQVASKVGRLVSAKLKLNTRRNECVSKQCSK